MGAGCSNHAKSDNKENIIVVPEVSAGRNKNSNATFSSQQTIDHATIDGVSSQNTNGEQLTNEDSQNNIPQTPPRSSQQIPPVKKSPLRKFFNFFKRKTKKKQSEQEFHEGEYEYYDDDEYDYDDEYYDEDGTYISEGREDSQQRLSTSYVPTYKGEDSDSQKKLQEHKDKIKIVRNVTATKVPEQYQEIVENDDDFNFASASNAGEYACSNELAHQPSYPIKQLEGIILPVAIPQTHLQNLQQQETALPQPSLKVPREEEWKRHFLNVELVYDGRGLSLKEKGWIEQQITGLVNVLLESGQIPEHLSIMNEQLFECKTVREEEAGVSMKVGRSRTETTQPATHRMFTPRNFQPQSSNRNKKGVKVGRDLHDEEFTEDDFDLSYDPYGIKQQRLEQYEQREIKKKYGFVMQELGRKLSQEMTQVVSDSSESNSYVTVREDFSDRDLRNQFENSRDTRTNGNLFPVPAAAITPKPFVRVTVSEMESEEERKHLILRSISESLVGLQSHRDEGNNEQYQPIFEQHTTMSASSPHFFRMNLQSRSDQPLSQILSSTDNKQLYEEQVYSKKSVKQDALHFISDSSTSSSTVDTVISPDSVKQRIKSNSDQQSFAAPLNKSSTQSPTKKQEMNTKSNIKRSCCEIKQLVKQVKSMSENKKLVGTKSRPAVSQRQIGKRGSGRCLFQPYKVTSALPARKDHNTSIAAGMKNCKKIPIRRPGSLQQQNLYGPNLPGSLSARNDNKMKGYRVYKAKNDTGSTARKRISNSLLNEVRDPMKSTGRMKAQSPGKKPIRVLRNQDAANSANVPLMRTPNSRQKDGRPSLSPVKTGQTVNEDRCEYRQIRHKVERNRQSISPLIVAKETGKEKIYKLEGNNAVTLDGKHATQMKIQDKKSETNAEDYQHDSNSMSEISMYATPTRPKVIHSNINVTRVGSLSDQTENSLQHNNQHSFQKACGINKVTQPVNRFNRSEDSLSTALSAHQELMQSLPQRRPLQSNVRITKQQHVSFAEKPSVVNQGINNSVSQYGGSHPSLFSSYHSSDQNAFANRVGFIPDQQNVLQFPIVARSASTDCGVGFKRIPCPQESGSTFVKPGAQNNYVHMRYLSEASPFQLNSISTPQFKESPMATSIQQRSVSYDSFENSGLVQNPLNINQRSYSTKPAYTLAPQKTMRNNECLEVLQTPLTERSRCNSDDIMWSDSPSKTHSNIPISSLAKSVSSLEDPGTSIKPRRWRQCAQEKDEGHEAWWMPESWAKERGIGQYGNQWKFEKEEKEKKDKELQIIRDANVEQIRTSRFIPL